MAVKNEADSIFCSIFEAKVGAIHRMAVKNEADSIFCSIFEAKVGAIHRMKVKNEADSIFCSIFEAKVGAIHRMSGRSTSKKEDRLPEGSRPPKRYGTGKKLSITLRRRAVRRRSGTASTQLRSRARACRSLHGGRPLQGSFRP